MPNNVDFSKIKNIKETKINPKGWVTPIFVEYGEGFLGNTPSYFWRVKGTSHTFVIPLVRMNYLSSGDYAKHFKEALEGFRDDFKEWSENCFGAPWMREYESQYKSFINL